MPPRQGRLVVQRPARAVRMAGLMPDWIVAVALAIVAASGAWIAARYGRLAAVERRQDELDTRNRALWLYCRQLIDHIWRGRGAPPPDPPDSIAGEFEFVANRKDPTL